MTNEFYEREGQMPWCSKCECYEEDCTCETISPDSAGCTRAAKAESNKQPVPSCSGTGTLSLDKVESFTQWLDARGDALAAPDNFSDWLNQHDDRL